MSISARFFLCARCRQQVVLCRRCDRGQRYCGSSCSQLSRTERQREARHRFAQSRAGRLDNARRQSRYRARLLAQRTHKTKIVTDQGSAPTGAINTLVCGASDVVVEPIKHQSARTRCRVCSQCCDPRLRSGFLPFNQRSRGNSCQSHEPIP